MWERGRFLVFSDIVIPGDISGLNLLDIIKAEYPDMEVVLSSGYLNRYGEFGSDDNGNAKDIRFLRKPFKEVDLAETLRKTLDPAVPPAAGRAEESQHDLLFVM